MNVILGQALETVAQWVGGGPGLAGGTLRADRVRDQCQRPSTFLMSEEMAMLEGPLQSSGGPRPAPGTRPARRAGVCQSNSVSSPAGRGKHRQCAI